MDWFFGVDMALYHTTGISPKVPVVPDAFLSLGVERKKEGKSRRSYATWEENDTVPILALEMVSHQPNDEYDVKRDLYAKLGVLYYVVYNPEYWQRDRHQPFEVYKLIGQTYQLQISEPFWMSEIDIGIGRSRRILGGIEQEVLLWFDADGNAYPTSDEIIASTKSELIAEHQKAQAEKQRADAEHQKAQAEKQRADAERQKAQIEKQRADAERQKAQVEKQRADAERQKTQAEKQRADAERQKTVQLAEYLRSLGVDPDNLPKS